MWVPLFHDYLRELNCRLIESERIKTLFSLKNISKNSIGSFAIISKGAMNKRPNLQTNPKEEDSRDHR